MSRIIDIRIAREIMGFDVGEDAEETGLVMKKNEIHTLSPYSTCISHAWLVVQEMERRYKVYPTIEGKNYCWEVSFNVSYGISKASALASTPAKAICEAALKAKVIRNRQNDEISNTREKFVLRDRARGIVRPKFDIEIHGDY